LLQIVPPAISLCLRGGGLPGNSTDGRSNGLVLHPGAQACFCLELPVARHQDGMVPWAAAGNKPKRETKCASPANDAFAYYWLLYKQ